MKRERTSRRRRPVQLGLALSTWGGRRRGAGRKPRAGQRGVPHLKRPALAARFPVHVSLKVVDELPGLRTATLRKVIEACFRQAQREGFRIVHYSIQAKHLHLIVEAKDSPAMSRGIQGLSIRLARRLNAALGRRGRVFCDRYFSRILRSPKQVKHCICYVLNNVRRHAAQRRIRIAWNWVDHCSSGRSFDGWRDRPRAPPPDEPTTMPPRTWLLAVGWRRHGLISINEVPGDPTT